MTIAWDRAILAAAILVACYLVAWAGRKLGADTAFRLVLALFVLIAAAVFVAPRSDLRQSNDAPTGSVSARDPASARRPSPAPSSFGGFSATGNRVEGQTGAPRPRTAASPSANPSHPKRGTGPAATAGPRPTFASSASIRTATPRRVAPHPSRALRGVGATWFCLPGKSACTARYSARGAYAAAGSRLRFALGSSWRGRYVTVSTGRASVRVRLVDWCSCSGIDLFAGVFAQLAPHGLSDGRLTVTVSW